MGRADLRRWCGPLAAVVALGGVFLATLVSPSFQWTGNALSNLGTASTPAGTELTARLSNGGLILGAVLGAGFVTWIRQSAGSGSQRTVSVLFALALVAMAGIGLFPQGTAVHLPVALAFYVLVSGLLWADAFLAIRRDRHRHAFAATILGTATIAAWVAWGLTGPIFRPGLALPEIVGAVAFAVWVVGVALGQSAADA